MGLYVLVGPLKSGMSSLLHFSRSLLLTLCFTFSKTYHATKPYFSGTAIDFILKYGESYKLFDIYFNRSMSWPPEEQNEFLRTYRVHNHSKHYLQDITTTAFGYGKYWNWSFYGPSCNSDEERRINNVFRFGNGANDRSFLPSLSR